MEEAIRKATGDEAGLTHPVLKDLAKKMPAHLLSSRSDNTVKKYYNYFKKWRNFIEEKGELSLPANAVHVALFITHLIEQSNSSNTILSCIYAIKWAHETCGFADPTSHPFVKSLIETAKRCCSVTKTKKDPVTSDMLRTLCFNYQASSDLLILRDLTMILFSFTGFLRYDECSNLRCCDVTVNADHLVLFLDHSKTDQFRHGNELVIAKLDSVACPYSMFLRYSAVAGINLQSSDYLFKPIYRSRDTCKFVSGNKKLSYSRARIAIVSRLKEVGIASKSFGLHSLRSGGATAAANAGVMDRCWKRHGRWKSDSAKDGYVEDSLSNRLEVTKSLGL